ncbi:hypothetical protein NC651_006910 [Populus alba x Populus x berolinensis]|nr:hypothetical protein NC651_006910 [Populus alba x Populus x berolinensis]
MHENTTGSWLREKTETKTVTKHIYPNVIVFPSQFPWTIILLPSSNSNQINTRIPVKPTTSQQKSSIFISNSRRNTPPLPMSINANFTFFFVLLSSLAISSFTDNLPTTYDVLSGYNFPIGILPIGATGYDLDKATGRFRAYLNGSCSFSLEGSYQLKYKSTVSGYISENKLTDLSGVSVKVLFFWLDIVEVVRKGDELEFSVGITSASFAIDNFYECPQCGCGFNCNNVERATKLRSGSGPFVSSF